MTDLETDLIQNPDYPALQQVARALWRNGSVRGAAVLVGAGLSKNAQRPGDDSPEPPLWWELLDKMIIRLYPHDKKGAPANPLRIAEEYRTFFGQAGLDDFIRTNFPDRSWSPGPLHTDLLELPWTDVLTTNWDTLLERGSENILDYTYTVVRTEADLTHAKSPRIVKLHGSIGDKGPLIFAEEDYRTYPAKYAAFVNLARQIFIENELVLVGFSGEDPNFLQWAGWVRDHLGGSARRIYLVGNLRLERAARKYLEAHNIAPIDLAPLVKLLATKDQHAAATRIFLDEMLKAKPAPANEWKQTADSDFPLRAQGHDFYQHITKNDSLAAELLEKTIPLLRTDRENYPGWLVCPVKHRSQLLHNGELVWLFRKSTLDLLPPKLRAEAVFEALWRRTAGYLPLDVRLISAMTEILEVSAPETDPALRLEFALALMRHAKISYDDDSLERWAVLIETEAHPSALIRQEVLYLRCLRLRDRMDLEGLAAGLAQLTSDDPIWKLRRASLHTEIGQFAKATKLIKDAAADLEKRHRLDRNSLWIKSRLAWANWISRACEAGNFESRTKSRAWDFKEFNIDPIYEIEYFEGRAVEIQKKRREAEVAIQPAFEAGHYREGNKTNRDDSGLDLSYAFSQLTESVGLPIRINHVNVCADAAEASLDVVYAPTVEWYVWLLRVLHSHFDSCFQRYFGRIAIAQLDANVSSALISIIEKAIVYWIARYKSVLGSELKDDFGCVLHTLRLLIVALSRMTVRMSEEHAVRTFNLAIERANDSLILHPWLHEALGDLMKYAAEAISSSRQGALALTAIEFPLSSEKGAHDRSWPAVISAIWKSTPSRDLNNVRWDSRVRELITAAGKGQPGRQEAILRLAYLTIRGALKPNERADFGEALWSDVDDHENALPINTGVVQSFYAELPTGGGIDARVRLSARLFGTDLRGVMQMAIQIDTREISKKQECLISLANISQVGMTLPGAAATRMFDEITGWERQQIDRKDPFAASFIKNFNDRVSDTAGEILNAVVVPSMPTADLTEDRLKALLSFIRCTQSWRGLGALPSFLAIAPSPTNDIISVVRRGMVNSDFQHAGCAANAIANWAKLVRNGTLSELPQPLVEQLLGTIETGRETGLQAMLSTARSLLEENFFNDNDISRLTHALEELRFEFRYEEIAFDSRKAVSISLVRTECIKLAASLRDRGVDNDTIHTWINEAKEDPLPEVRFSLVRA